MKYMLLIYGDEALLCESVREKCYEESTELVHDLAAKGQFLATAPLQPTATATTVRVRDGKRLVTDGPFAETKEQLAGYYTLNCKNLDEALELAAKIPKVIYQQPCYCYCDRGMGHTSLHSCFAGTHGAVCSTCLKELYYTYAMNKQGKSSREIREGIIKGDWKTVDLQTAATIE